MALHLHKQTATVFILSALVVGGAAVYTFRGGNMALPNAQMEVRASAKTTLPENYDWRSEFLTVATTNDTKTEDGQKEPVAPEKETLSYALGKNFLTQYALLRQVGLHEDESVLNSSMNKVAAQSVESVPPPKLYSISNVSVVVDSNTSLKTYGDLVRSISLQYARRADEAEIAATAFENENPASLSALDPIVAQYASMSTRLRAAKVPSSLAAYHVDLVNGMTALWWSSQAFRHMDTDPLTGFAAIKVNAVATQTTDAAMQMILEKTANFATKI